MDGVKSTSFVFSGLQPVAQEPFACFCEEDANHCHLEMYPRPNGEFHCSILQYHPYFRHILLTLSLDVWTLRGSVYLRLRW